MEEITGEAGRDDPSHTSRFAADGYAVFRLVPTAAPRAVVVGPRSVAGAIS